MATRAYIEETVEGPREAETKTLYHHIFTTNSHNFFSLLSSFEHLLGTVPIAYTCDVHRSLARSPILWPPDELTDLQTKRQKQVLSSSPPLPKFGFGHLVSDPWKVCSVLHGVRGYPSKNGQAKKPCNQVPCVLKMLTFLYKHLKRSHSYIHACMASTANWQIFFVV